MIRARRPNALKVLLAGVAGGLYTVAPGGHGVANAGLQPGGVSSVAREDLHGSSGAGSASAASGHRRAQHAGKVLPKCPDFRGQFVFPDNEYSVSSGGGLVMIEQKGCSTILYKEGNGTAVTMILDGKPRKSVGEDGRTVIRTSTWHGVAAQLEERLYSKNGDYLSRGISDTSINEDGDIVIYIRVYKSFADKEVPEGNPVVHVARRVGATPTPSGHP